MHSPGIWGTLHFGNMPLAVLFSKLSRTSPFSPSRRRTRLFFWLTPASPLELIVALHEALHHSCPTILIGPCHERLCPVVSCQAKEKHGEVWLQISNFHVKTAGPNFTRPSIGQHCLCPEICFTCANSSPVSGLLGYSSTARGIDKVFSAYQST